VKSKKEKQKLSYKI